MVWNYEAMSERMLNDHSLVEIIIVHFLNNIPSQIETLTQNIQKGELKLIQHQSHFIKGSVANIGGEAMLDVTSSIEEESGRGNLEKIQSLLPVLVSHFNDLEEILTEYLNK